MSEQALRRSQMEELTHVRTNVVVILVEPEGQTCREASEPAAVVRRREDRPSRLLRGTSPGFTVIQAQAQSVDVYTHPRA